MKFTPAPWEIEDASTDSMFSKGWRTIVSPTRRVVGIGGYHSNKDGEVCGVVISEADAHLIAAAPEMYEALEHIYNLHSIRGFTLEDADYGVMAKIATVLRKAEGVKI